MNSLSSTNASIAQWWSNRLLTGRLQVRALFGAPRRLLWQSFFCFYLGLEPFFGVPTKLNVLKGKGETEQRCMCEQKRTRTKSESFDAEPCSGRQEDCFGGLFFCFYFRLEPISGFSQYLSLNKLKIYLFKS